MNGEKIFLSSNIKYLRVLNNKTQEDVAKICNKKNTAISNWEKGIREPDAIDLTLLSEYFKINIDDLMLKDLRITDNIIKQSKFHHTDEDSGLSVEIITTNIDWDNLSKEDKEQYINKAIDTLYEAKKNIRNDE